MSGTFTVRNPAIEQRRPLLKVTVPERPALAAATEPADIDDDDESDDRYFQDEDKDADDEEDTDDDDDTPSVGDF